MSRMPLLCTVAILTTAAAFGQPGVSKPVKPTTHPSLRELAQRQLTTEEPKELKPERKTLDEQLAKYKGARLATISPVESAELTTLFPKTVFFSLWFRRYPVAIAPSEPLKTNNIFAVTGKEVVHLKSAEELGAYFQNHLNLVKGLATAKTAAIAQLLLVREFQQDGFFQFQKPEITVTSGKGGPIAQGAVQVVENRGDKGKLTVLMSFLEGRLETVKFGGKVFPGIRPRCQATRLLDPDPAVREIMRRDLIVMGSSATRYLTEQWQKASPQLRDVLDDVWQQIVDEDR
jgi:hypothetical protein